MVSSQLYKKEISYYITNNIDIISQLDGKRILITGAAGLIGSYLVDLLINYNINNNGNIKICALDINKELSEFRFKEYHNEKTFNLLIQDIIETKDFDFTFDYVIHAASNTSPTDYVSRPINTMLTNVIGNYNILEYIKDKGIKKYLFCSSVEVYGLNDGSVELFDEKYSGYVDCNTLRSNYPTVKRACESMCNAYMSEYDVDFSIARIGRIYGPTVINGDAKATTQLIFNGVNHENIILKSNGLQKYSYCYVGDCAIALLYILVLGKKGEAYNVSDKNSAVLLKDFAGEIANIANSEILFEKQTELEKKAYSNVTKAVMNVDKIYELGWKPLYDIKKGLKNTIEILGGK